MIPNKIVTYSFLAYINNTGIGIRDFSDIFIPLVKRVLSKMNEEGHNKGKDLGEIKIKIDTMYYLDVPYPFLRKLLDRIAKEINEDGETKFMLYKDGSFIIKNFVFADYEETIRSQENEVSDVEELYHQYLQLNNIDVEQQPSIFDFIDRNRASLSRYFIERPVDQSEADFSIQAKFINSIKQNRNIYNTLQRIYIGSIISAYLEFETEGKSIKENVEFVLDTNFIVSLLDLTTTESTHTCTKIIEICKKFGYRISVLDYTIEETRGLLSRTAEQFDISFLSGRVNPESIYNACERRGLSKTDLERIVFNLENIISEDLGLYIVPETKKFRNEAKFSSEFEKFKKIRVNDWSALHDATAVKYVQYKRGKRVTDFFRSKCWFVTNPHHEYKFLTRDGFVPEIISAEDLVNILWLTNPNVKANMNENDLSEIGISRLISSTLNASMPNARVIKEFEQNIQKYAKDNISDKEIIRVSNRIANKTNINLEELNKIASINPSEFVRRLQIEAKLEEKEQAQFQEKLKKVIFRIKEQTEERSNIRAQGIKEEFKQKDIDLKQKLLSDKKAAFKIITKTKNICEKRAIMRANIYLGLIILLPLCVVFFLEINIGWNITASFILTLIFYFASYLYFVINRKEWSLKEIWNDLKDREMEKQYKMYGMDIEKHNILQSEIEQLEDELNNL